MNGSLINKRLQVCFLFDEPDGRQLLSWCKGVVVAVKKKNIVFIKWDQELLRDGESETTQQKLAFRKWRKSDNNGWRYDVEVDE